MLMILAVVVTVIAVAGMLYLCELRVDEKQQLGYWAHDGAKHRQSRFPWDARLGHPQN